MCAGRSPLHPHSPPRNYGVTTDQAPALPLRCALRSRTWCWHPTRLRQRSNHPTLNTAEAVVAAEAMVAEGEGEEWVEAVARAVEPVAAVVDTAAQPAAVRAEARAAAEGVLHRGAVER